MNTIIGNGLDTYRHTQQADKQNRARTGNGNWGRTAEPLYEDARSMNTKDSGISAQEAYERLGGSGKILPEAEQLPLAESEIEKVTEIGVASLSNGVSFYFNDDTGEVICVNDNDSRPGRQVLWRKSLSPEDMARRDKLFDNYADVTAGGFVFRYQAYLKLRSSGICI